MYRKFAKMLTILMILGLLITAMPASANPPSGPRLLISHIECVQAGKLEVHFLLNNAPSPPRNYGSVAYTMSTPGGNINGTAAFDKVVGGQNNYVAHYNGYPLGDWPSGTYKIVSASVTVNGQTYNLANPDNSYNISACGLYEPCDETVRGKELSREGPYYKDGKLCYRVTYQLVDKHDPTYACGQETVEECKPYTLCTEKTDWSAWTYTSDWIWDPVAKDFYRTKVRYRYDKYVKDKICDTETGKDWKGYKECTDLTDWKRGEEGLWFLEYGKVCRWVVYNRFDKYTGRVCQTEKRKECDYKPCTMVGPWELVHTGDWYYKDGKLCQKLDYVKRDFFYKDIVCEKKTEEKCKPYKECTDLVRGNEIGREGPYWPGGGVVCYNVTYERVDKWTGKVCGKETVKECVKVPRAVEIRLANFTKTPVEGCGYNRYNVRSGNVQVWIQASGEEVFMPYLVTVRDKATNAVLFTWTGTPPAVPAGAINDARNTPGKIKWVLSVNLNLTLGQTIEFKIETLGPGRVHAESYLGVGFCPR